MKIIYLVVLIDDRTGERAPILACADEETAEAIVGKMGSAGDVERVPLLEASAD